MVDELERLRRLREDAPPPDASWVDDTRSQLLAMADEEAATAGAEESPASSAVGRFLDGLVAAFRRPAVAAAAAAVLLATVGVTVWQLTDVPRPDRELVQPGTPDDATPTTPGTSSPTAGAQLAASCSGGDGAYTISYPEGWHTNPGDQMGPCQVFDRQPIALDEGVGGGTFGPITVEVVPAPFDVVRDPGRSADVRRSEPTTVDGSDAVRQTIEYTGETSLPRGMLAYRYVVDLGDRTLLAVAYELPGEPFERNRDLLDDMVRSLELTPTG